MVHIPEIRAINSLCPNCGTRFGYVVEDGKVACPACRWVQLLPIIKIELQEYLCIPCNVDFTVPDGSPIACPECHFPVGWSVKT